MVFWNYHFPTKKLRKILLAPNSVASGPQSSLTQPRTSVSDENSSFSSFSFHICHHKNSKPTQQIQAGVGSIVFYITLSILTPLTKPNPNKSFCLALRMSTKADTYQWCYQPVSWADSQILSPSLGQLGLWGTNLPFQQASEYICAKKFRCKEITDSWLNFTCQMINSTYAMHKGPILGT